MSIPLVQEEREIEAKDRAFNAMKEIADRAMKLAEMGENPRSKRSWNG